MADRPDPVTSPGMAERVAAFDWAATPLGGRGGWPPELRAAIDLMLASPYLATLTVGAARVLLYNDVAAALYGDAHPGALGRPIADTWPEAWAQAGHHYDRAFAGECVHIPAEPLDLERPGAGQVFDAYLTPVRAADGRVVAAHMAGFEVGARLRAEAALRESEERFRLLADVAPHLVWSGPDGRADFYNRRWLDYTGLSFEESCRPDAWWRVVHPDDLPEAARRSERSRLTGEPYEVEYRLRRADGAYRWHIARAERAPGGGRWVGAATDIHDARAALDAAEASERRLTVLMEGVPQLVWRAAPTGSWTWAGPQWADATGQAVEDSLGHGWMERVHPDDRAGVGRAWHHAFANGEYEVEHRLRDGRDGVDDAYRWYGSRALPVRDEAGAVVEWLGTSTDIDELRRLQERQTVLVEELQHRTRNLIALVRSVADRTVRGAADLPGFRGPFLDRLDAMGRAQGLLSRLHEGDRVLWDELLRSELAAMGAGDGKVRLDGPDGVRLRSGAVQMIAMAVHELATNAVKYGALGRPGGRLAVSWRVEPDAAGAPKLHVDWTESGVAMPPPGAVQGGGQGRELIERALPYQLGARTRLEMRADGVRCELWLPVSER